MNSYFTSKFFLGNREALLKNTDANLIVLAANVELQRNGDVAYPFRQDSNFWYLTGIEEPNFILVMSRQEIYLIKPARHTVKDMFNGTIDDHEIKQTSGIDTIFNEHQGWQKLSQQLRHYKTVATQLPMIDKHFDVTANPACQQLITKMRRCVTGLRVKNIRQTLARLRMVKQDAELAVIQKAIDITNKTIKQLFTGEWYVNLQTEYQIEAAVTSGFRANGANGNSFPSIIAAGKHACQIHYTKNNGQLKKGELLLIDVGAEVSNYAADISRTLPIGKIMRGRQKEVFDAVRDVQTYAYSQLKPGVSMRDCEQLIENYMGTVLRNLGLFRKATHRAIRRYYPHACSHMLGLDVHDAADYTQPLAVGMVITVEPGIYILEEGIGVRLEDDVVITNNGVQVLSKQLPSQLW